MAVTYKGLTIKFGGDTTDLQKKLGEIQKTAKNTNADLKAVNKSLQFNPGNTDLLNQKVRNLSQAISDTGSKLKAYKAGLAELDEEARKNGGLTEEQQRQYDALQRGVLQCENQLDSYTTQLKQTEAEYEASKTKLYQFGQTLEDNTDKFKAAGDKMQAIGGAATKYVTLPLVGIGTAAAKTAIDVDDALTGVRKTVDATEEEYKALKDAAVAYSETNAISAIDILNAEELAGQLGVAKENLFEFAKVATGLDLATDMDVESASSNLAQFANVTNMSKLEGEDAARAYRAYGNVIVGLGNNSATTESKISDFSLRIASAGTQAGMSEAEIMGISAAMASLGLEAASGGSAFSKTISDIGIAVATGSEDLEKYASLAGMSAQEFADYWKNDAANAFIDFVGGVSTSGEDMNVVLEDLGITELRQSDALRRLAGNTDLVRDSVKLANEQWENGTALADEVANKNQAMSAKFEMLEHKVTGVLEKVGGPLVDALLDAIDAADPLIQTISDLAQKFADADEDDQRMILGLAAAAAAFGPIMSIAGSFVGNIGAVGTGIKMATTAFSGLELGLGAGALTFGAVGIAIAAVAGALIYFFTQTETGKQMWADFTSWISEKWQGVKDFLSGIPDWWGGITTGIAEWNETTREDMLATWEDLKTGLSNDWQTLKDTASQRWTEMGEYFAIKNEEMRQNAQDKWNEINTDIADKLDDIKSGASNKLAEIKSDVQTSWESVRSTTSDKWNDIKGTVTSAAGSMRDTLSDQLGAARDTVSGIFDSIRSSIQDKLSSARDTVGDLIESIRSKFDFSWSLPHLSLPHLWVSGSFSINPPSVPSFGIDWYAKGGAIEPNNPRLIGVGDAREREWIEPESKLLSIIQDAMRGVAGGASNVSVEVNVTATVTGRQSAYELGQDIGRGISSTMKQRGYSYA